MAGHNVDVELWNEKAGKRIWSCAYLASVWQLLRLGLLRHGGSEVLPPQSWDGDFPVEWDDLPAIIQLNAGAMPFSAYKTFSVLPARFVQVEHAVRVILEQVAPLEAVLEQIAERAGRDNVPVSRNVTDRIEYVFFSEP